MIGNETVDVAGVLVRARPEALARVSAHIGTLPGADVHASDPGGKLVVTLEATSCDLPRRLDEIRAVAGVLSVSLVYEHTDVDGDTGFFEPADAIDRCRQATPGGDA